MRRQAEEDHVERGRKASNGDDTNSSSCLSVTILGLRDLLQSEDIDKEQTATFIRELGKEMRWDAILFSCRATFSRHPGIIHC